MYNLNILLRGGGGEGKRKCGLPSLSHFVHSRYDRISSGGTEGGPDDTRYSVLICLTKLSNPNDRVSSSFFFNFFSFTFEDIFFPLSNDSALVTRVPFTKDLNLSGYPTLGPSMKEKKHVLQQRNVNIFYLDSLFHTTI
jgi:hypothetical protein